MKKQKVIIEMFNVVGSFAENKDVAKKIRLKEILPTLQANNSVILDFAEVSNTTQSFIHALISEVIRSYGIDVLDRVVFKNCNEKVKDIISIVTDYMQYEG